MGKIELNEKQIQVIQDQLNGKIEVWSATEEQQKLLTEVIDMADDLLDTMPDDYDFGDDLIKWFWEQYQAQSDGKEGHKEI